MAGGKGVYYPELDSLRFLAFLLVFIHHTTPLITTLGLLKPFESFWLAIHQYGWMGVDLFLCLSAFLFTKLLFIEHDTRGDISVKNFYIRRLLRIWPLYFVFISLMILKTISSVGWSGPVALRSIGLATFTDNIFAAFLGYNMIFSSQHLWTISYEEQFYAVIPWSLRRLFRMSKMDKLKVVLAVFFCFSAIRAIMIYQDVNHPAIWVLPITHFEAILGGILIGLGWFDYMGRKVSYRLLLLAGIVCLILVCKLPNVNVIGWHLMLTYPLVGAGVSLIVYSVLKEEWSFLKNIYQNRTTAYLGKISYGLYVYHLLAIYCARLVAARFNIFPDRMIVFPPVIFILGFCLTVLFSVISYHFLERPFLRYKKKFTSIESRPI